MSWGGRARGGWRTLCGLCLVIGWAVFSPSVQAHKTSDSYLRLALDAGGGVTGEWALALHDLEFALGLDGNGDGAITWGELKSRREAVIAYARDRLALEVDGRGVQVRMEPDLLVDQLANGGYAVLRFRSGESDAGAGVQGPGGGVGPGRGVRPEVLTVEYRVFFDIDRLHRGLVRVETDGGVQQAVFNPVDTRLRFVLGAPEVGREFGRFFREGVWHIWIGYDHLLFLVILLLPSVLRRQEGEWVPVDGFRGSLTHLLKVVTAFTVAHSITLALAAGGWVRLPGRWVETAIAASIVVAALNNVRPLVTGRTWAIAFGFGLVHGFGFASVLADLGLPAGALVRTLVGFNLGVEAGQLAVVGVVFPVIHMLRRTRVYPGWVLRGGSLAVAVLAGWWVVGRWQGG